MDNQNIPNQGMNVPPKKKKGNGCLFAGIAGVIGIVVIGIVILMMIIIGIVVVIGLSSDDTSDSTATAVTEAVDGNDVTNNAGEVRSKYTQIVGDGSDVTTIMIYIIGADLESVDGAATFDLEEIKNANLGDNVNVIIQTGGCTDWKTPEIREDTCQRFQIVDNQLVLVQDDLGLLNMTEGSTLTDFVSFCSTNYPANRYDLILWDHGGGTICGYGCDENFPEDDGMQLNELDEALTNANIKFDFIGFDACLMGTVEVAYMLEQHCDYLIASAELEPGEGWYYTDWLTELGSNPSMATVDIAKTLIDTYVATCNEYDSTVETTLAIVDLTEIPYVYTELCEFLDIAEVELQNMNYERISVARANSKAFGMGEYEQVDIIDFITKSELDGNDLTNALNSAVKYRNSSNIEGYNGLAMYFPYSDIEYYDQIRTVIGECGLGDDYTGFFTDFVSILSGGQLSDDSSNSPVQDLTGSTEETTDFSGEAWYDDIIVEEYSDFYEESITTDYPLVDMGEYYAVELTDEDWANITNIEQQVWIDDGEGYIDLGSDDVYELDENDNLIAEFDGTWVAIDGMIVPYYAEARDYEVENWYTYGYVPAMLNGDTEIDLMLRWDSEHEDGYIAGYRLYTEDLEVSGKGWYDFQEGDLIDILCEYYTYDGEYDSEYYYGDTITYSPDLVISYEDIGDTPCLASYMIVDIYQNSYWTEELTYNYE